MSLGVILANQTFSYFTLVHNVQLFHCYNVNHKCIYVYFLCKVGSLHHAVVQHSGREVYTLNALLLVDIVQGIEKSGDSGMGGTECTVPHVKGGLTADKMGKLFPGKLVVVLLN